MRHALVIRFFKPLSILLFSIVLSFNSMADTIKIGMTTALEGPAKGLGANIKLGIDTYLNHINRQGGVNGETSSN